MTSQYGELRPTSGWDRLLVWGTPANFNWFRVLAALLHGTLVVGVSQTLRRWTEGATYVRPGDHHVGPHSSFRSLWCSVFDCQIVINVSSVPFILNVTVHCTVMFAYKGRISSCYVEAKNGSYGIFLPVSNSQRGLLCGSSLHFAWVVWRRKMYWGHARSAGALANLKGHYFQPSLPVCLCVCVRVCLTGTSTLQRWPILMKLGRKNPTLI